MKKLSRGSIETLCKIYMQEYKPDQKQYTITNYFNYNYFHSLDITYQENEFTKVVHTLELNITSEKMVDLVLKDESIKKHLINNQ